jgi:hypothetical protein
MVRVHYTGHFVLTSERQFGFQQMSDPPEPLTAILFEPAVFLPDRTNRSSEIAF